MFSPLPELKRCFKIDKECELWFCKTTRINVYNEYYHPGEMFIHEETVNRTHLVVIVASHTGRVCCTSVAGH
jgi:hypothetical protein